MRTIKTYSNGAPFYNAFTKTLSLFLPVRCSDMISSTGMGMSAQREWTNTPLRSVFIGRTRNGADQEMAHDKLESCDSMARRISEGGARCLFKQRSGKLVSSS